LFKFRGGGNRASKATQVCNLHWLASRQSHAWAFPPVMTTRQVKPKMIERSMDTSDVLNAAVVLTLRATTASL
jgi:hypothetical protein